MRQVMVLALLIAVQPALSAEAVLLRPIVEQPPDLQRRCIPGPHEPGRTRRMPGLPATSAAPWLRSKSMDAFPHCRYDSRSDAERAAQQDASW